MNLVDMPSRPVSSAEILAARALERQCGQECVDWAVTMLIEGSDTPHLRMLAGREHPHSHFELANLRDRALDELGQGRVSRDHAVRLYARERLQAAIAGHGDLPTEVAVVAQLCAENDYARDLYDFFLLHNAYDDLKTSGRQWYWPEADRSNILEIMTRRAQEFVSDEEGETHRPSPRTWPPGA